jgi:hypothetical protein
MRDLVEGRGARQGHPDLDDLLAYAERRLEADRAERLKDHLATCPECAKLFLDLKAFAKDVNAQNDQAEPSARAEAAWWELQSRIQGEEKRGASADFSSEAKEPEPVRRLEAPAPLPKTANDRGLSWLKLMAALLAIAVVGLVYPYIHGKSGVREARVRHYPLRIEAPLESESGTRGLSLDREARAITIHTGDHSVVDITLPVDATPYEDFQVSIMDEASRGSVWKKEENAPGEEKRFSFDLTPGELPPGRYQLQIHGLENGRQDRLVGQAVLEVTQ